MEADRKCHISLVTSAHGGPASEQDGSDSVDVSLFIFHKHRGICINICSVSHTHRHHALSQTTRTKYTRSHTEKNCCSSMVNFIWRVLPSVKQKNIVGAMTLHFPHSDSKLCSSTYPCFLGLVLNEMCLTSLCGHKPVN